MWKSFILHKTIIRHMRVIQSNFFNKYNRQSRKISSISYVILIIIYSTFPTRAQMKHNQIKEKILQLHFFTFTFTLTYKCTWVPLGSRPRTFVSKSKTLTYLRYKGWRVTDEQQINKGKRTNPKVMAIPKLATMMPKKTPLSSSWWWWEFALILPNCPTPRQEVGLTLRPPE